MKLSIEEKAKRYDETIEQLRAMMPNWENLSYNGKTFLLDLVHIIPELKESKEESEDERIRKSLSTYFAKFKPNDMWDDDFSFGDIVAWFEKGQEPKKVSIWKHWKDGIAGNEGEKLIYLVKEDDTYRLTSCLAFECDYIELSELDSLMFEKQSEKTSDKIVEKARTEKQRVLLTETDGSANIDWDCRSLDDVKTLLKCGLEFIRTIEANKQILPDSRFGGCSFRVPTRYDKGIKQGEQKPNTQHSTEWSVSDFRTWQYIVSDVLTKKDGIGQYLDSGECKKIAKYMQEEWSKKLSVEQMPKELLKGEDYGIDGLYHAISILEKTLGKVDGYQSDDGILEHKCAISAVKKLYEQKPWSEEDEKMLGKCIDAASGYYSPEDKQSMKDWLYFLKERYTWKPSEEQMDALYTYIYNPQYFSSPDPRMELVESVYQDLKKLMDR